MLGPNAKRRMLSKRARSNSAVVVCAGRVVSGGHSDRFQSPLFAGWRAWSVAHGCQPSIAVGLGTETIRPQAGGSSW